MVAEGVTLFLRFSIPESGLRRTGPPIGNACASVSRGTIWNVMFDLHRNACLVSQPDETLDGTDVELVPTIELLGGSDELELFQQPIQDCSLIV